MAHLLRSVPPLAWSMLVMLVAGVCPAPALQAQERLTLEDAVRLARQHNPELQVASGEADLTEWEVRSAVGRLFPSAMASSGVSWQGAGEQRFGSLTAGQLGFGDQPSFLFSSFSLGLEYTLDGSRLRAPARARASRSAARARRQDVETAVVLQVTRAYLDLQRQTRLVEVVEAELERAQANLRLARAQEAVGSATMLDVQQAEVQVGRADVALLRAEQAMHTSQLALLEQIGIELDREVVPVTELPVEAPTRDEEELFQAAVDRNAGLEALRADREGARIGVASARSSYYPTVSLQAGISGFTRRASQSDFLLAQVEQQEQQLVGQCQFQNEIFRRLAEPLPSEDCDQFRLTEAQRQAALDQNRRFPFDFTRQPPQVSVTVSLPIFQGLERQRQLEEARVQQNNATLRLRQEERRLRVEISRLAAELRTAHRTVELEERNQALAEDQLRLARSRFEVGESSFLELAEAEGVKAQADRDHLEAVFQYHDARARIEAVVGGGLVER